ncbi:MAG: 2-phospho-L-lactate guanylyltransferase [Halieaceae bacterium]
MVWALLPVKDLVRAKSRLSGILAPHERRALAQAMVEDVLSTLVAEPGLAGVLLVSDDPAAELLANKYGVESLSETALGCTGLNPVIEAACALLAGRGEPPVMVVHSDIPLLQRRDLRALLTRFRNPDRDLVLSPDLAGEGTNIMLFGSKRRPPFHYGPGSCAAHSAAARARGMNLQILDLDNVGLDIDEPADLLMLYQRIRAGERGEHTAALLLDSEIGQRLSLLRDNGLPALRETDTESGAESESGAGT